MHHDFWTKSFKKLKSANASIFHAISKKRGGWRNIMPKLAFHSNLSFITNSSHNSVESIDMGNNLISDVFSEDVGRINASAVAGKNVVFFVISNPHIGITIICRTLNYTILALGTRLATYLQENDNTILFAIVLKSAENPSKLERMSSRYSNYRCI
ncbi:hypothetical protein DVP09_14195 [Yersinia enterocolitica]|nr:hypothetical protein [Yersinia enterocolitica]EKN5052167.1 hypothetical protein [Yersinia enterocolitica]EKN5096053.1 hypothetical protein [Yersinia enterocolitica]EKN6089478.1 hypothetical protein [Yersinia enterocolitica]EKN6384785.1 hypothetical protein [Yersinia enterocolitica]